MGQTAKTFAQANLTRAMSSVYTVSNSANPPIVNDMITDIRLSNNTKLRNPLAPTVANVGTTGSTVYNYYLVANDAWGGKTMVGAVGSTNTGNATLSGTNYNSITFPIAPGTNGIVSYDVLKGNTTTSLATGVTTASVNDTGQATAGYTAPTSNTTGIKAFVSLHHVLSGGSVTNQNKFVNGYEVDPGVPADLQVNVVMLPGDMIQGAVDSNVNADTAIDNLVSISLGGVETT